MIYVVIAFSLIQIVSTVVTLTFISWAVEQFCKVNSKKYYGDK